MISILLCALSLPADCPACARLDAVRIEVRQAVVTAATAPVKALRRTVAAVRERQPVRRLLTRVQVRPTITAVGKRIRSVAGG